MASTKLSITMERTLELIRCSGGEVHPEKGGWWRSQPDGERLYIQKDDCRYTSAVGTTTIYSLFKRGLLEKIDGSGSRVHPAFRIKT